MPNRLAQETSPYLLQHKDNPVDWFAWGDDAFQAAKAANKPILLSIGYAACHWCHVMAHESFEDESIAALMNQYYINVKVDREERPDVDQIYMNAVVAMTQQGGWPLTAILTPEGEPFFGGTYFPKEPRYGMASFPQVLVSVAQAWAQDEAKIRDSATGITNHISRAFGLMGDGDLLSDSMLDRALAKVKQEYDREWGGFGDAPKFPQPMNLEFLARLTLLRPDDADILQMFENTLDKMARGGMYDQVGGGFARYSTDRKWLVPHFEKMLYDNAQLARVYLHAWQLTGRPLYKRVVEETLDYVVREMTHDLGGFYSSQDADSEGEEGKFYVWQLAEVQELLGEDTFPISVYYDVTMHGNWEGKTILNMPRSHAEAADTLKMTSEELDDIVARARKTLYDVRSQRIWPGLDDKVLTAWNGLMLAAFAEAGRVLNRADYIDVAVKNAEFLRAHMRGMDGRLWRTWKDGSVAKYNGYLEDYAFLADGLLALYQTTFDERWFTWAHELGELIVTHFVDDEGGGFYDTSDDHEALIFRPKDVQDNALPSGNSSAAHLLLQLSLYTGNGRYWDVAEAALSAMYGAMLQYPNGFGHWLSGATLMLGDAKEIAIVGDPHAEDTQALIATATESFRPFQIMAVGTDGDAIELLAERPQIDGQATAYVCRKFACQAPTTEVGQLASQLA